MDALDCIYLPFGGKYMERTLSLSNASWCLTYAAVLYAAILPIAARYCCDLRR